MTCAPVHNFLNHPRCRCETSKTWKNFRHGSERGVSLFLSLAVTPRRVTCLRLITLTFAVVNWCARDSCCIVSQFHWPLLSLASQLCIDFFPHLPGHNRFKSLNRNRTQPGTSILGFTSFASRQWFVTSLIQRCV